MKLQKICLPLLSCFMIAGALHAKPAMEAPNSQMKAVLDELAAKKGKPIETLDAADARKQPTPTDAVMSLLRDMKKPTTPEKVAKVEDRSIRGAAGDIPARFYYPEGAGSGALPVIVYYHGGGWVIATNDTYDATPRSLANLTKAIVISVEYRKAPEHKFPAAHEDAFAAYKWTVENAASFNGDPKKIAVAGESAGGNMAMNVSIMARDQKMMLPVHELLVYPVASTDMTSESFKKNADAKPLNKAMMGWFSKQYLNTMEEAKDPRMNLVSANLKGLPPTTIISAEIDPLRTGGKELADKLRAAGVEVEYKNYDGVTHEFFGMSAVLDAAKNAQELAATELKDSFRK
jgi:acetyl esterase